MSTEKNPVEMARELARARDRERTDRRKKALDDAQSELERILTWFSPVLRTAQMFRDDPDGVRHMYVYTAQRAAGLVPEVYAEICGRNDYAKDTNRYRFEPAACRRVRLSVQPTLVGTPYGKERRHDISVEDAVAKIIDCAADMMRSR